MLPGGRKVIQKYMAEVAKLGRGNLNNSINGCYTEAQVYIRVT